MVLSARGSSAGRPRHAPSARGGHELLGVAPSPPPARDGAARREGNGSRFTLSLSSHPSSPQGCDCHGSGDLRRPQEVLGEESHEEKVKSSLCHPASARPARMRREWTALAALLRRVPPRRRALSLQLQPQPACSPAGPGIAAAGTSRPLSNSRRPCPARTHPVEKLFIIKTHCHKLLFEFFLVLAPKGADPTSPGHGVTGQPLCTWACASPGLQKGADGTVGQTHSLPELQSGPDKNPHCYSFTALYPINKINRLHWARDCHSRGFYRPDRLFWVMRNGGDIQDSSRPRGPPAWGPLT